MKGMQRNVAWREEGSGRNSVANDSGRVREAEHCADWTPREGDARHLQRIACKGRIAAANWILGRGQAGTMGEQGYGRRERVVFWLSPWGPAKTKASPFGQAVAVPFQTPARF